MNIMNRGVAERESPALFFYADEDAEVYDELAPLTDPAYVEIHDALVSQTAAWLASTRHHSRENVLFVDVGCGTGEEAIRLLSSCPQARVVAVDISERMLQVFRRKVRRTFRSETASDRCLLLQADFRDDKWLSNALSVTGSQNWPRSCNAVISVYALHHLDALVKKKLYQCIYQHIQPGGVFVNADLMSFEAPWLAEHAQSLIEQWITRHFDSASLANGQQSDADNGNWKRLKEQWLQHVRYENHLLPALSSSASSTAMDSVATEEELLRAAGFHGVDCTFRHGQSAILWAFKEATP